ncbi:ankyrin repeat and BTB/POZ domain-containing protein 1 isoform X1 [Micropterus dolomieu]|uniref:ankyrin repeat and BTB/POZ domain-containing protein 1 isoform X1 n=2 Tax=Micropterus dolomieu TaxID=147949 RepID=UPI001E8E34AE|nr:ankyrin repeat and BTB/POZ domain-containing protein 1 isoform X1 [Micropterus dolomieu]
MDVYDLFSSCRKGDICRVRYLVEQRDVDLNVRDKWDSTPLYYACLCGHEELVQYLLASGAKCEANTFDGERCMYGSLNDSVRRLLKDYKCVSVRAMQRDDFNYFLHMLLEQGQHSDVKFLVHGQIFTAHRCVLSARSEYFTDMFETKWKGKNLITLKHPLVNPAAFGAILQYFYTGRMDIDISLVEDSRRLAKQCKMADLIEELENKCKQVYEFVFNKPGVCVKVLSLEPNSCQLQDEMAQLADCALPTELRVGFGELPFNRVDCFPTYPDICFRVDGYNFLCHKAFFSGRSDYFKALLEDHFSEGEQLQSQPSTPVITLHNIAHEIFANIMYYIYTDDTELTSENVFDVLCVADMYLLPGLKRLCGKTLAKITCEDNVLNMWKTAKLFRLSRLEDHCTEFMAKIIDRLVEQDEFAEIIKEDAASLEERHETDSVPLVDDIRYHIASNVQTYSAIEEANQKLEALEELLSSINIEC